MAELLLHHFTQEMVLFQLEQDMGEQLEARYGEHFGLIQSQYLNAEADAEAQDDQTAGSKSGAEYEADSDPIDGDSNRNTA